MKGLFTFPNHQKCAYQIQNLWLIRFECIEFAIQDAGLHASQNTVSQGANQCCTVLFLWIFFRAEEVCVAANVFTFHLSSAIWYGVDIPLVIHAITSIRSFPFVIHFSGVTSLNHLLIFISSLGWLCQNELSIFIAQSSKYRLHKKKND